MKLSLPSKLKRSIALFLTALMLIYTAGCSYYGVNRTSQDKLPKLVEMGRYNKYFVVHQGNEIFHLVEPMVEDNVLKGTLADASNDPIYYNETRKKRFRESERSILNEIHIYPVEDYELLSLGEFAIPITQIHEIRVIRADIGRTVLAIVGTTLGAVAIISIFALLTKSSCPYVYVHDGEGLVFEGEMYGGAILQNLERDDYMPLPHLRADGSAYRLYIANELKEEQFTNLVNLVVVDHPENTNALLDQRGQPHLLQVLQSPIRAITATGKDIGPQLQQTDRNIFLFDEVDAPAHEANLLFEKPENATSGKLVLNAKNALWFDWLFGEFTKKFGGFYDQWIEKQANLTGEERRQMAVDQQFPLSVSVRISDQWQLVEHIPTVGPLASRDLVIPIDLREHQGNQLEIRLQSGFLFWELDYAAMDFSPDTQLKVREFAPISAIGNDGQDHLEALLADDDLYLEQLKTGDVTKLQFSSVPVAEGRNQTTFLHSKGYYKHVREYEGLPQMAELRKFRTPGHFTEFSKEMYLYITAGNEEEVAVNNQ
ncbi:MAG: hypothetical protein R2824_08205 [Saprospiraceae bacterium]|nr:hypothetical protein [Lewinella sp.]